MTVQEAFQQLRNRPEYFLKWYPVKTAGAPANQHNANQANVIQFAIQKQQSDNRPGHVGATRPGPVLPFVTHNISSFKLAYWNSSNPHEPRQQVQAHSVPMFAYNAPGINVQALDAYILDGGGDGVMATGQLSGCCFCILPLTGGRLACTHIRPLGIGAPALQTSIDNNGAFNLGVGLAAAPGATMVTFGRNDYPAYATVIGVRSGGTWRIYAQLSTDQSRTINGFRRIYPNPAVLR